MEIVEVMQMRTRRTFLRASLLGAAVSLAAACGPASSAPGPSAPAGSGAANPTAAPKPTSAAAPAATTAAGGAAVASGPTAPPSGAVVSKTGRVQLPSYLPPNGAAADVPGGKITPPGYTAYPKQLIRSVPNPPGKGGEISIITQTLATVPRAMDSNPVWQELNKRVGATLTLNITPFADYGTKIPTILASGDMPDMLFLPNGQQVPGYPAFLDATCADLTPFLSGDAIKNYPNLAAHPTSVWNTTVINNKIYGVGDPIPPYFWVHWHHAELLQQANLQLPKTLADYKSIMQTLLNPNGGQFGLVAEVGYQYGYGVINQLFTSIHGAPNQWSLQNGKLTRLFETDQFKAAVGAARDFWAAGLYEPGGPGYNTLSARDAFLARKGVFRWDGNTADVFNGRGSGGAIVQLQPPSMNRLVPPFGADASTKPTYPLYHGSFGTIVLKKASDDRIRELLGVLNVLASPFGTEERELIQFGLEGRDFTRNQDGAPILNDDGRADWMQWVVADIVNPAPVYFDPLGPDYVQHVVSTLKAYEAVGVTDPTVGFYSETSGRQGLIASQRFGDGITDIVAGRRPMSDLDSLISEWRSNGGDQVRQEYQDAMAAAA
jgi:putative aldouronate transport system substrate-binding protein